MPPATCPVTPGFAAEIGDLDLSRPLDEATIEAVRDAFWTYSVLIFPDQHLDADQHLDFARHFGPLESTRGAYRFDAAPRTHPEFSCGSFRRAGEPRCTCRPTRPACSTCPRRKDER